MAHLDFTNVTFFHEGSHESIFEDLTLRLHDGWTAVVGPNGAGKTTLLRLAAGEFDPDRGAVRGPGSGVYCAQRTDDPPDELAEFLEAADRRANNLRGRLAVLDDSLDRWPSLSHGERKRAQIAVALWRDPAMLLLDEPTNHVDADGRSLLLGVLKAFRGVGLLVTHDRSMMEALCVRTLFVTPGEADLRSGTYSAASEERANEQENVRRHLAKERRELKRLDAEAKRRKQKAEGVSRGLSKKGIARGDSSAKERIDRARLAGVEGKAMERSHQLDGRRRQVEERIDELELKRERRLGITQPGSRSQRNTLVEIPAGEMPLPDGRVVVHPRLTIAPDDRIGVTGPNGTGKTTLVEHILARLDLPDGRVVVMPQELTAAEAGRIAAEVQGLPRASRGRVATVVSRLGSDPERVLETTEPSPGELRKLLLALGFANEPWILVMDEPTNHLDLPSVECLEATLADFPGALLLVSHDHEFLDRTVEVGWKLSEDRLEVHAGDR